MENHVAELEALCRQLQQLQESFAVVIEETRPTPENPVLVPWPDLLSKFNILAAKYAVLSQAVNQKYANLLKELAVAPAAQPSGIHEQGIMAVLLRTKLAPEIEKEEEGIWARVEEETKQDKQLDWLTRAERHESLAIAGMSTFVDQRRKHTETVESIVQEKLAAGADDMELDPVKQVALEDILSFVSH